MKNLLLWGEQIRAGRSFLRIEQAELARESGLSLKTVKRLERMHGPIDANTRTLAGLIGAFHRMGVVFDLNTGTGPGLRLAHPSAERDSVN